MHNTHWGWQYRKDFRIIVLNKLICANGTCRLMWKKHLWSFMFKVENNLQSLCWRFFFPLSPASLRLKLFQKFIISFICERTASFINTSISWGYQQRQFFPTPSPFSFSTFFFLSLNQVKTCTSVFYEVVFSIVSPCEKFSMWEMAKLAKWNQKEFYLLMLLIVKIEPKEICGVIVYQHSRELAVSSF